MTNVVQFRAQANRRKRRPIPFGVSVGALLCLAFGAGATASHFSSGLGSTPANLTGKHPRQATLYTHCTGSIRINCVVDGDTIWMAGVKIRVADIDTPEVSTPKCQAEKALGDQATVRLLQLVNAGPFEVRAWSGKDEDRYGRKLRVLVRDGRSLGDILVSEGLARTWTGRRQPWC